MKEVKRLLAEGHSGRHIAREVGVTRQTVSRWKNHGFPDRPDPDRFVGWRPPDGSAYSYLLGLYLGDGTVTNHGGHFGLSITLDDCYPGVIASAERAMVAVGAPKVGRYQRPENHGLRLYSYWQAWPVVFPQHGAGRKHMRKIELVGWQEKILDSDPQPFLRGLIHSDGSRCINRFEVKLKGGVRSYAYPRYFFTNYSADIRGLFCRYCDALEIRWTQSSFKNISVSHRDSVAVLDSFIGPKT